MPNDFESLAQSIGDRLTAIGEQVSEARIRALITTILTDEIKAREGHAAPSKFLFGNGGGDARLIGSKYARWNYTVADIEFLFDLQNAIMGQRRPTRDGVYEGPSEELRGAFSALSSALYIPDAEIRKIDQRALDDLFPRVPVSAFPLWDQALAKRGAWEQTTAYQRAMRAMDTAESGYGQQLVGATYVGDLWAAARSLSRIFALIESFEMRDPTAYLPVEVDIPEMLFVSESTTYNATDYTTVKTGSQRVQVDAKKFAIHQKWSGELDEDSIVPFVPFLRQQASLALQYYSDAVVLNADNTNAGTGNINSDDADPADTKYFLAFDGIRHASLVDVTAGRTDIAGPVTYKHLVGVKTKMLDRTYLHDWGHPSDPADLVYAVEPATGDAVANLDEIVKSKQERQRPLLTGEIADILGHPVISTMAIPLTDADGKYTTTSPATNDTKGTVQAFNRRAFKVGWRRRVRVESDRIIGTDQTRIMYSMRLGFGRFTPTGAASGILSAHALYDITL